MNTLYYKFPDSGTAYEKLSEAGFFVSGQEGMTLNAFTFDYLIDVIGKIKENEDFYHLNLRIISDSFSPPSAIEPFLIDAPSNPIRVFL